MVTKPIAILVASAAYLFVCAGAASAQGFGRGPVATFCAPEISRYCAHERHGAGAVRACLESNRRRLSHDCRNALGSTAGGQRWR
jgi:hypothetical protein